MHYPQLLIYETDRRLATLLQRLADKNNWLLRQPRQPSAVLRLLDRGGPGVFLLRLSRDLERELALLEQVSWLHPDASTVVVADNEQRELSSLVWDLGARWVLLPPHTRERLEEIVFRLMEQYQPTLSNNINLPCRQAEAKHD
jgi:DNA-binding NtrC family response regulator